MMMAQVQLETGAAKPTPLVGADSCPPPWAGLPRRPFWASQAFPGALGPPRRVRLAAAAQGRGLSGQAWGASKLWDFGGLEEAA